jgi:hypothetical protein
MVNTGEYFYANMLHGADPEILEGEYVTKNQKIGRRSNVGAEGVHLHLGAALL